jgi:hypothetical protein
MLHPPSAFARRFPPGRTPPRTLVAERKTHFFVWFHLEPADAPVTAGRPTWHSFRPSGPAFHPLVALDVGVDADSAIREARLGLDRAFIDGREDAFARDIAASFLRWALDAGAVERAGPLIASIADLSAANAPVVAAAMPPDPPADPTGAYAVFLGLRDAAALALGTAELRLAHFAGPLPPGSIFDAAARVPAGPGPAWLRIDVALKR